MSTAVTEFRYHTETVGGVTREKPVPKRLHAIIMRRIMAALLEQTKGTGYEIYPELDLLCGPDRYCPDVLVTASDAKFTRGMLDDGALLAVEIMSPGQTIGRLIQKGEAYVRHGITTCWIIWPERQRAWICESGIRSADDWGFREISGTDAALLAVGSVMLQVELRDLFSNLPDDATDSDIV